MVSTSNVSTWHTYSLHMWRLRVNPIFPMLNLTLNFDHWRLLPSLSHSLILLDITIEFCKSIQHSSMEANVRLSSNMIYELWPFSSTFNAFTMVTTYFDRTHPIIPLKVASQFNSSPWTLLEVIVSISS